MRFVRALAVSSFLASGISCGGGDLGLPEDQSPAEITVVAGNGPVGAVGSELSSPQVVRVDEVATEPGSQSWMVSCRPVHRYSNATCGAPNRVRRHRHGVSNS